MTIAFNPLTITDSISRISIPNVTIKDVDEIPQSANLLTPIVFPQPDGWLDGVVPEVMSFGSLGTQKMNVTYTLHYVYLFAETGSGISQTDNYLPMAEKFIEILNAIFNNDVVTGAVDLKLAGVEGLGEVADPSGNNYWGALFSLQVLEYA